MNYQQKSKEELIEELELLQQKNNSLNEKFNALITEHKQTEQALAQSQELMRYVIEHNPSAVAIHDKDLKYMYVSQAYLKDYKVKEKDIIGKHHYDVFTDLPQKWKDVHQKALAGEILSADNDTYLREDGTLEWTRWECHPWYGSNGSIGGIIIYTEVITERKNAELRLKESELKFRSITEQTNDLIAITDTSGILTYASSASKSLFQYNPEEMCGQHFIKFVDEPAISYAIKAFKDGLNEGLRIRSREFSMKRKDGSVFIGELNASSFKQGLMNGILVVIRDITERKRAEEKIREKDIEFRKLSTNLPDLIFQFTRRPDGSYCVPIASEGIKNIFGCSPEDVLEDFDPIGKVIHPDDAERVISDIEYSAKHLTYFTCEFRVQIPGRETQWIFSRSTPEKLPDGSITWYGFNANITQLKNTEQELIHAKEQALESDRLKSAFLANMSHEIRTPMNGILGFAELLKTPNLTGVQQQEYIKIIEKSGARMLNIINDIIEISKIDSGLMKINISETNFNQQLDFLYTFFKIQADAKGLSFIIKKTLSLKEAIVQTDKEKMYSILTNLLKNAIKYTNKGFIEFGYSIKPEKTNRVLQMFDVNQNLELEFYIKDSGIGIPTDRQSAVFERFIQEDIEDKMAQQGAGLGLAITKSYVEMLGGKIWVESEEGAGSTFYFTLPYSYPDSELMPVSRLITDNRIENLELPLLNKYKITVVR